MLRRAWWLLAAPLCLLFACCRSQPLEPAAAHATLATAVEDARELIAAPAPSGSPLAAPDDAHSRMRLARRPAALRRAAAPALALPAAESQRLTPAAGQAAPEVRRGRVAGRVASRRAGLFDRRFQASISYQDPDLIGVGIFYSLSDRLTVGVVGQRVKQERTAQVDGQLIDPNDLQSFIDDVSVGEKTTSFSVGPFVLFRLSDESANRPSLSLGAYALEWGDTTSVSTTYDNPSLILNKEQNQAKKGEDPDTFRSVFLSASKRLPLGSRSGFLRSMRVYGGAGYGARTGWRYAAAKTGAGDPRVLLQRKRLTRHSFIGWVGAEVQLPARFYAYAELFTGDECAGAFALGVRWRSPIGITFSLGIYDCFEPIPSRALDLIYDPGGVGGQPAVLKNGYGSDAGALSGGYDVDPADDY